LRLTFRVNPCDKAVGTYHLEVKEKLSAFIYNFELEKAEALLEDLDPQVFAKDLILRAEFNLMKLYTLIKTEEPSVWMSYAGQHVLPLIQNKVFETN
jgi:hypothetical protein